MNQYGTHPGGSAMPQESSYPQTTYPQVPPMSHAQTFPYSQGPPTVAMGPAPPRTGYSPPSVDYSYNQRPSRMSVGRPPTMARRRSESQTHYGHLVSEDKGDVPCSGDACGACCKYNTIGCLLCCNGWLRLCGGGTSIKNILSGK
ncbi:hypothetical protein GGI25_001096 [Coemansia spiralis]|uniref:Uncharacterized protein n=2 Tax=Coemansia TaxID=4863 RepID=A0A9W8L0M2_9FUNG|nr:hypothetical protein BX070DRAFT_230589 [Coemansia spiralis]KAJ1995528.1 hypothetical protein EDC05_000766 [Coemansia umbellata]KAJ2625140.1 hypothetical protein GGI26_000943 [Coemansia sp. RSA 1358]KAJ2679907.1 hypothetical protein GGI25_001096 [Coemansia spiralis]